MPATTHERRAAICPSGQGTGNLTDDELLAGIRQGSEAHFSELYNRYFQRIYTFSYARLRNHADAEEITQETFTAVFRFFAAYRGQSTLLSWIYGIAKNTANSHLRRHKVHETRMERADPDIFQPSASQATYTPEDQLQLQRCAQNMKDQLASISEWQTEIFVMRHLENLSIREIVDRTHRSSDAIRSSLYRVKRLLVESVQPDLATAG